MREFMYVLLGSALAPSIPAELITLGFISETPTWLVRQSVNPPTSLSSATSCRSLKPLACTETPRVILFSSSEGSRSASKQDASAARSSDSPQL